MAGKFDKLNDDDFEKEMRQIVKVSEDYVKANIVLDVIRAETNFDDLRNQVEQNEKRRKRFLWLLIALVTIIALGLYLSFTSKEKGKLDELTPRVDSLTMLKNSYKSIKKVANINVIKTEDYDSNKDETNVLNFIEHLKNQGYTNVNLKYIFFSEATIKDSNVACSDVISKINLMKTSKNNISNSFLTKSIGKSESNNSIYHLLLGKLTYINQNEKEMNSLTNLLTKYKDIDTIISLTRFKNENKFNKKYHTRYF